LLESENTWTKTMRPTFEEVYMQFAISISQRSTCSRLQVGAVITTTDFRKVLAIGYNGNASGLPNRCDSDEPGKCGCLHAEENAVINCDSPRIVNKIFFCTHLPCTMCAKRIINLGNVKRVIFKDSYRVQDSIAMLYGVGIDVYRLDECVLVGPLRDYNDNK
jgi:dCMP deaminase